MIQFRLPAAAGAKGDLIPSDIPFLGDINSIGEGIPDLASVLPGVSIAPTQLLPTAISLTGVPTLSTPTILLTPSDSA